MKEWTKPEVEVLGVENTQQGTKFSASYDEIRIDQNGKTWYSFASGAEYDGPIDGKVEVIE